MIEKQGAGVVSRLAWAAVLAAAGLALAFAWRPVASKDLGYHLAYGTTFLRTGHIVDGSDLVYVEVSPRTLAGPGNAPPGSWVDRAEMRYRFPNANYASQIVMALAYRVGGFRALTVLQVGLAAIVMTFLVLTMRRFRVPAPAIAAGTLASSIVLCERLTLRPELFGYVFLAAILWLVSTPRIHRRTVVLLAVTQAGFVQFHSYWLLGLALPGAMLTESALRAAWTRFVAGRRPAAADRERLRLLALAMAAMTVVSFVNPWTWRLVRFPFDTLAFLSAHGATSPWAAIRELRPPFDVGSDLFRTRATRAFVLILAVAAAGGVVTAWRRRWGRALMLAGMAAASLRMRRNIAPAAVVLVPVALACLADALRGGGRNGGRGARPPSRSGTRLRGIPRWAGPVASLATLALAVVWTAGVVTGGFYFADRWPWRFGDGEPTPDLPLEASRLLATLPDSARVFTSFNVSSTVAFFAAGPSGFRHVPILTNTWAYPVAEMARNARLCSGKADFRAFAARWDVGCVVLECAPQNTSLLATLRASDVWIPLHFDGWNVLYARSDLAPPGAGVDFGNADSWTPGLPSRRKPRALSLHRTATALYVLGRLDAAEPLFRECVRLVPDYYEAWNMLGSTLLTRAQRSGDGTDAADASATRDRLAEAAACFRNALAIRPDYSYARRNLELASPPSGR